MMITIQEQLTMWANHSLNMDTMKIRLPNGELVSQARFNHMHIGDYFAMGTSNERPTRNAYTAYTKNMAYRPVMYWNETRNIPPMTERIP